MTTMLTCMKNIHFLQRLTCRRPGGLRNFIKSLKFIAVLLNDVITKNEMCFIQSFVQCILYESFLPVVNNMIQGNSTAQVES